jgi:hypothetical protein
MVYDSARQRVVLFGGADNNSVANDETWEWDGTDWTLKAPATKPPARTMHGMVYDSARQRVLLYGGAPNGGSALSDTWAYDGVDWVEQHPAHGPGWRQEQGMAYDAARQRTVLYGGVTSSPGNWYLMQDTWEWDGNDWTQSLSASSVGVRRDFGMTWDPVTHLTILYGGNRETGTPSDALTDTWGWDGTSWTLLNNDEYSLVDPYGRDGNMMALVFDSWRNRLILTGGYNSDTWELESMGWRAMSEGARDNLGEMGMAYDEARRQVVLFGGRSGTTWYDKTWVYSP